MLLTFQVLSCNLYGVISSIVPAKYPGNRRHSLLVAVGEAQLAVVDYDPSAHCFKTRMLYNYEQDDQRQMFLQQTFSPQVSVLFITHFIYNTLKYKQSQISF